MEILDFQAIYPKAKKAKKGQRRQRKGNEGGSGEKETAEMQIGKERDEEFGTQQKELGELTSPIAKWEIWVR